MKVLVAYPHFESSSSLNDFIRSNVEKMSRFFRRPPFMEWVVSKEGDRFKVAVDVSSGKVHEHFVAESHHPHRAVRKVLSKMKRVLKKNRS